MDLLCRCFWLSVSSSAFASGCWRCYWQCVLCELGAAFSLRFCLWQAIPESKVGADAVRVSAATTGLWSPPPPPSSRPGSRQYTVVSVMLAPGRTSSSATKGAERRGGEGRCRHRHSTTDVVIPTLHRIRCGTVREPVS